MTIIKENDDNYATDEHETKNINKEDDETRQ